MGQRDYIAIDTETHLIEPGNLAPKLVCMSECVGVKTKLYGYDDALERFYELIQDQYIVGHNIAYDLAVMCNEVDGFLPLVFKAYDEGRIWDTMIHEKLRMISLGYSRFNPQTGRPPRYTLESLVETYLDESIEGKHGEDAWRLRYAELDNIPTERWPNAAKRYALLDAEYTYRVFLLQRCNEFPTLRDQFRAAWGLHLMSCWGIATDKEAVSGLETRLHQSVDAVIEDLKSDNIIRSTGSKNLSVIRELVTKSYGGSPPMTAKGSVSTAASVLKDSGNPLLEKLASVSADQKLLNTYVPLLQKPTVNPRFNVLVASGRTSSSNPNIQNQPRKGGVRECFAPRPGNYFIACDYHVAELCSLAQVLLDQFGMSKMAEALQAGRELHLETAAGIMACSYEEAVRLHEAGDKEAKEARQLAKMLNFGLPGGISSRTFVDFARGYGVEITEERAQMLKQAWLSRYPEINLYFEAVGIRCAEEGGSFFAVHPSTGFERGGVGFCDGCNHYFQHLTAAGAKEAVYQVAKACWVPGGKLEGCKPVAFIHDEIILEAPKENASDLAKIVEEIMIETMQKFLPDIPVKADAALMERWYKGAEPVTKDGRLIPWSP